MPGLFIRRDMHGTGRANEFLLRVEQFVGESKRGIADFFRCDLDFDDIPDKQRQLVIRFGMDDGEEVAFVADQFREAEADRFQQGFVGVMHDLELMAEEEEPSRVGIM